MKQIPGSRSSRANCSPVARHLPAHAAFDRAALEAPGLVTALAVMLFFTGSAFRISAEATNHLGHSCCASAQVSEPLSAGLTERSLYQLASVWTNDDGVAVKLSSLRGRPQIVPMFFANCAYACPLLVFQMKQIEEALPESLRNKVGFVLVSFDTERDTPAALHAYRLQHELAPDRWTLLRGSPDNVLDLAALLNVKFKKDAQGQFVHSNAITLLNPQGELIYQKLGLNTDLQEIVSRAAALARE